MRCRTEIVSLQSFFWYAASMKLLAALLLVIIVVIAVQLISKNAKRNSKSSAIYRYGRKDFFMNRAEHEFFDVLIDAVGSSYYVFPQVHLSTILEHRIKGQDWRAAFKRINGKSVDFVICDKAYIKPLLAIELDGRSHDVEAVRQRDADVEHIFEKAELRLLRFANHGSPNREEVKRRISEALSNV
jgi:very-short-patch-repair endonuclease